MKDQRTFAPEDLFELKFLQNAHFSPDGTQVVYTVSHVETSDDPDEEKEYQTIWLLTLATGKARQMTTGKALDGSPRISPAARRLRSSRIGATAHKFTHFPSTVARRRRSPT